MYSRYVSLYPGSAANVSTFFGVTAWHPSVSTVFKHRKTADELNGVNRQLGCSGSAPGAMG